MSSLGHIHEPEDPTLLYGQPHHMSQQSADDTVSLIDVVCLPYTFVTNSVFFFFFLKITATDRRRDDRYFRAGKCWALDPRTRAYVDLAGFGYCADISRIVCDMGLLHALTERWRPETHTFHLRWGEMTVTLRDVQLLLGLQITG
jgi:hypothetical protein